MTPARIVLLLVALIAGGLAAFLATRGDQPAPVVADQPIIVAPTTQVLVATSDIGVGQRITAESVGWQDWPETALRGDYITVASMPDAPTQVAGAVARFEIFAGDPIREQRLVRSDQGYLSAVLSQGMRGVSIAVTPESGSGGFIIPNDRVDVVQTRSSETGQVSETILSNVKVLAIGKRLGEAGTTGAPTDPADPSSQVFENSTIATLELDPIQAETVINAAAVGRLSLALRSIADFTEAGGSVRRPPNSQAIRVIRYGQEKSVLSASGNVVAQDQPAVDPASFTPSPVTSPVSAPVPVPVPVTPETEPPAPPPPEVPLQ